ncbi:MAG: hypothetical protein A2Y77_08110 [Planctomycetes bacterium RBG_13_62_9]|nr:MAG: hypothetical protein A2Y77_08110 [Planctomycetes bacterium RBG_13_62_9]
MTLGQVLQRLQNGPGHPLTPELRSHEHPLDFDCGLIPWSERSAGGIFRRGPRHDEAAGGPEFRRVDAIDRLAGVALLQLGVQFRDEAGADHVGHRRLHDFDIHTGSPSGLRRYRTSS